MWCPSNNCWIVPSTTVPWKEQSIIYLKTDHLCEIHCLQTLTLLLELHLSALENCRQGEGRGRSWLGIQMLGTSYRVENLLSPPYPPLPFRNVFKLWSKVKILGKNIPLFLLPNLNTALGLTIQTWSSRISFVRVLFQVQSIEIKPKWGLGL